MTTAKRLTEKEKTGCCRFCKGISWTVLFYPFIMVHRGEYKMEKITSFCIDHDILDKGMYISRIDGDIITYDLRMVKPNCGM